MPSRSETARINGAKSRGPKSLETRQKSSRNSLRHGLTAASTITMECESPEEFQKFLDEFIAMHQPATAAERDMVDQMVAARWRIRRAGTMEIGLLDTEMARRKSETLKEFPHADTAIHMSEALRSLADDSKSLALLSRYEARLQRTYERAYKTLRDLQQARKSAEQPSPSPNPPGPVGQASRPVSVQADSLPAPRPTPPPTHWKQSQPQPKLSK